MRRPAPEDETCRSLKRQRVDDGDSNGASAGVQLHRGREKPVASHYRVPPSPPDAPTLTIAQNTSLWLVTAMRRWRRSRRGRLASW